LLWNCKIGNLVLIIEQQDYGLPDRYLFKFVVEIASDLHGLLLTIICSDNYLVVCQWFHKGPRELAVDTLGGRGRPALRPGTKRLLTAKDHVHDLTRLIDQEYRRQSDRHRSHLAANERAYAIGLLLFAFRLNHGPFLPHHKWLGEPTVNNLMQPHFAHAMITQHRILLIEDNQQLIAFFERPDTLFLSLLGRQISWRDAACIDFYLIPPYILDRPNNNAVCRQQYGLVSRHWPLKEQHDDE